MFGPSFGPNGWNGTSIEISDASAAIFGLAQPSPIVYFLFAMIFRAHRHHHHHGFLPRPMRSV
jgi:hypothetical protein